MGIELEKWVRLQGWEECHTATGERYFCRKRPKMQRMAIFDSGRVVIGWHDVGEAHSVSQLVNLIMTYGEG
jgi:hypothetical protein